MKWVFLWLSKPKLNFVTIFLNSYLVFYVNMWVKRSRSYAVILFSRLVLLIETSVVVGNVQLHIQYNTRRKTYSMGLRRKAFTNFKCFFWYVFGIVLVFLSYVTIFMSWGIAILFLLERGWWFEVGWWKEPLEIKTGCWFHISVHLPQSWA